MCGVHRAAAKLGTACGGDRPRRRSAAGPSLPKRAVLRWSGVTLVELLVASTVVAVLVGAMAMMAAGLRTQQQISQEYAAATLHARASLDRVQRAIQRAYANAQFPGFVAFGQVVGPYTYPDCLVVWRPAGRPVNPQGLPLWQEVVIFGWNPDEPSQFIEVTVPGNANPVPALSDGAAWLAQLTAYRRGKGSQRVVLTDRLRVAASSAAAGEKRGVVCFFTELRPSSSQWDDMVAGKRSWESLSWPLDMYGTTYGVRQNHCRIELQLRVANGPTAEDVLPFVGSASVYFAVTKP